MTLDPNAPTPGGTPPAPVTPPAAPPAAPPSSATPPAAPANGDIWYFKPDMGFDKETQDYLASKNFGTPADAIKAARQFEQLARDRNALTGPADGKLLEWEGWQKFGWEPDAAKFKVDPPALKEGAMYEPEFHQALTKGFHKGRLAPDQVKAVMEEIGSGINAASEAAMADLARQDAAMKQRLQAEWGTQYDANLETAKRAASALLSKDQMSAIEDAFGNPALIEIFHKIGSMIGEDKLVTSSNGGQGGFGGKSPDQIKADIARQNADADFVRSLSDATHPLHEQNNAQRREQFLQLANAGQR